MTAKTRTLALPQNQSNDEPSRTIVLPAISPDVREEDIARAVSDFVANQRSAGTSRVYAIEINKFFEFLSDEGGRGRAGEFGTPRQLGQAYLNHIKTFCAPATIKRKIAILRSFFAELHEDGKITRNPFARIKTPVVTDIRKTYCPTDEEVKELLKRFETKTYRGLRDYTLVFLMAATGLRQTEARTLKASNIQETGDGEKKIRFIHVVVKGGGEWRIPIHDQLHAMLRRLLKHKEGIVSGDACLFTATIRGNKPVSSAHVEKTIRRATTNPKITPHSLRKYFINCAAKTTGNNQRETQLLARHKSPASTQIYLEDHEQLCRYAEDVVEIRPVQA